MIFPQVDPVEWAERYGLTVPEGLCRKCGHPQAFVKPFAYKTFRGLISSHGECGEEFRQSVFASADQKDRMALGAFVADFWAQSQGSE